MDIRQFEYLVALARERNFTRAAQVCNVTQPTLSSRIRQLEEELGTAIVARGSRFVGFTREGEGVLRWAREILDARTAMLQEVARVRGTPLGMVTLGVIPSALPMAARLTGQAMAVLPDARFTVHSESSTAIHRRLADLELDAGITYLEPVPAEGAGRQGGQQGAAPATGMKGPPLRSVPLYEERYCLLVDGGHGLAEADAVDWDAAARERLCLLTPNMQYRRFIDQTFGSLGLAPEPLLESDSIVNLLANVRSNGLASIVPRNFLDLLGPMTDLRMVPLVAPEVRHQVGLVALDRQPPQALIAALFRAAGQLAAE
ncbi:LysR family transcriptional regulator [Marinibaculum pumilum]|uniref:LysR family transcriptional regulator n=1 Tax=Marinibaculum pumilum TaxID=1766165 RepID=A0ABV7L2T6_9PROT